MSNVSIKSWVKVEAENYNDFGEYVATKVEGAWVRALHETMARKLKTADAVQVTLPWGTYYATKKTKDGENVIDISWEISKGFKKLLDSSSDTNTFDRSYQDEFDPEFVKLFTDYLAYGKFDPSDETKNDTTKTRGLLFDDSEVTYFLNSYVLALYEVAKDKQREGKAYRLEIDEDCPHGSFDFLYKGDDIDVKFIPHKIFKQALKDDTVREKLNDGSCSPVVDLK